MHYIDFLSGSVAGLTCKLFEFPFDTVKVLQQTTFKGVGAASCLYSTVQIKGIRGLYNGLFTPLLSCTFETAILFYVYEKSKEVITTRTTNHSSVTTPVWIHAMAGLVAGACTPLLVTPVEFIKCNLQVQGVTRLKYTGPLDCTLKTIKEKGIKGMYKGFFATVLRESPGSSLWFVAYETSITTLSQPGQTKNDLPLWKLMLAGAFSGVAYWTAFFPADVIKTQVQTMQEGNQKFWTIFSKIWRTSGFRGLYRGYWITVARAIPSNAILFVSYEACKRALSYL